MADGKIKGITVEIGGDLNPLAKAIKAANKPISAMQRELKGIETLLKMDPSNVDLLRQKEELLTKSISETETKLNALKKAKEQADKDMASGTQVNQDEYRKLVREIASTENKLDGLTQSMKEFGSVGAQQVKKVGDDMKDLGDKMQNVGGKMSTMVTAPVAAGVAAVTEGTRELRSDLARLEVNAEQTGRSLDDMSGYMTQIVGVTGEVDSSVEGLSNLLATGISDKGFAEVMDALSGAAIKFSDTLKFEGIADGLQETLATGAAVGPFAELLERSGIVLDDFNAGLTAAIASGEQENFILQTLANTGLADFYAAYREGNPDLVEAAEAQYHLQEELAKIGELLDPIVAKIVEFAAKLLEKFNSLSPSMQTFILAIVGIAAALGPVIVVLGSLLTGLASLLAIAPQLATALGVVKAAFAAIGGPVTVVIAVITALMLKFIHAYNTSEEFRNKVNAAFNSVKDTVSAVVTAVSEKVKEFISIGRNMVEGLWEGISNAKSWLLAKIKDWCGSILKGIKAFFGIHSPSRVMKEEVGEQLTAGMAEGIESGTSDVEQAVDNMGASVLNKFDGVLTDVQTEIDNRADAIAGFAGIFDAVAEETEIGGDTLIDNLAGQVALLEQWQTDMEELMARGITGSMLEELREQGPQAAAEIHAMTQMSDTELAEFGELYAEKIKLATETAVNELGGLQLAITPVVSDMAANASYAVGTETTSKQDEEKERQELYEIIANMFATALLEGLNYVGNSIFDAIPKVLEFYIDSTKMAKTTWDAFDTEGDRRNKYFAPSHDEIYRIALKAAKCNCD